MSMIAIRFLLVLCLVAIGNGSPLTQGQELREYTSIRYESNVIM